MQFDPVNLILCLLLFLALFEIVKYRSENERGQMIAKALLAWIFLHNGDRLPSVKEVEDAYKKIF